MNSEAFLAKFGPWAVVTGASSGIGTGFARALAAKGLNLALVARREAQLKELADELQVAHGVQTVVVACDLSQPGFLDDLRATTDGLDVVLLVSNAGAGALGAMLRVDVDELAHMLRLNTEAHLRLAHHYGQHLLGRGTGGIVLIGSMAGMQGTPLSGNYAGAKAYVHTLGQALNYELRRTGVNVTVVVPGPTRTPGLTERSDIDLTKLPGPVMEVDTLVAIGLKALAKNRPLIVAGAANRLTDATMRRLLPRQAARNLMGAMLTRHAPPELTIRP